jgi:hypothetical protein
MTNLIPTDKNDFENYFKKMFERAKEINKELTELEYIQSEIDSLLPTARETKQQNLIEYIQYLSYYTSEVNWELKDYYNDYINPKSENRSFRMVLIYSSQISFNKHVQRLAEYKERFEYIYKRLETETEREYLKDSLIENLEHQVKHETKRAYITPIQKLINEVKEFESKQTEPKKEITETQPKYNNIFTENNFEIWSKLFSEFVIKESSKTDLRFMFEVMKAKNQINDTVGIIDYTNWLNKLKDWKIDKLQFTNYRSETNSKRLTIYKNVMTLNTI